MHCIELFVSANACESGHHTTRWVRRPAPGATHVIRGLIKQYRLQHLAAAAAAVVLASMHVVGCEKYQEHLPISPVLTAADPEVGQRGPPRGNHRGVQCLSPASCVATWEVSQYTRFGSVTEMHSQGPSLYSPMHTERPAACGHT